MKKAYLVKVIHTFYTAVIEETGNDAVERVNQLFANPFDLGKSLQRADETRVVEVVAEER